MKIDQELSRAQAAAVEQMLRPEAENGAILAFDMGLGKTRTAVLLASKLGQRCILVVAPLQTIDDWIKTVAAEWPEQPSYVIDSSATGKENLSAFHWRQRGIYFVGSTMWERLAWNKEEVKKVRATQKTTYRKVSSGIWSGDKFMFVYDESHQSANWENWTSRALMMLDPRVYKLSLSGTFMGDRFDGAFGATRWVWPHRRDIIPNNIYDWRALWAEVEYDRWAPKNQKTTGEKVEGAFVSSLPCYIRMETDIPPAIVLDVMLELGNEQRRVYDELDDYMVAWVKDNPLVADYSITKRARQRQVTLAYPELLFENGELLDVSFADDAESIKIDSFFADLDGDGPLGTKYPEHKTLMVDEQILVLTDSQKFARLLTKRLNDKYGDTAREWSGKTRKKPSKRTPDGKDRKTIKQEFIDGKIRFLVGVQAAMGTGTDGLQAATHIVVTMSRADRRISNEQGIARANRKGQEQRVYDIRYLATDTIDLGQVSKQMEDALKMQRIMKAKAKKEERERRQERLSLLRA